VHCISEFLLPLGLAGPFSIDLGWLPSVAIGCGDTFAEIVDKCWISTVFHLLVIVFSSYLDDTISYLVACLKKERERSAAFQAIGLLSVAVQRDISKHLKRIMEVIKQALPAKDVPQKKQKNLLVESSVFTCISMLAKAVGPDIEDDIRELLEPMLAVGLR
jgi:hypothetical protein